MTSCFIANLSFNFAGERIFRIGEHLAKLRARLHCLVFWTHGVDSSCVIRIFIGKACTKHHFWIVWIIPRIRQFINGRWSVCVLAVIATLIHSMRVNSHLNSSDMSAHRDSKVWDIANFALVRFQHLVLFLNVEISVTMCGVIAKFHYTDPHGPDRTRTDFFCGETPLGPCWSGRVRVVEFSSYSTTCADFVRVRSVSGPCSGI